MIQRYTTNPIIISNIHQELYIEEFASGHRRKGMSKLRTPEKDEVRNLILLVFFFSHSLVALYTSCLENWVLYRFDYSLVCSGNPACIRYKRSRICPQYVFQSTGICLFLFTYPLLFGVCSQHTCLDALSNQL